MNAAEALRQADGNRGSAAGTFSEDQYVGTCAAHSTSIYLSLPNVHNPQSKDSALGI